MSEKCWRVRFGVIVLFMLAILGQDAMAQNLTGSGATFPAPLYQKWFRTYKAETGIEIEYQAIGSGGGVKAITEHTVDFGASDLPLTEEQAKAAPGILQIPMTAAPVAVVYNIPGVDGPGLRMDGEVLADIYLGKITRWSDSHITRLNPRIKLPNLKITPIHSGDSHTTMLFTHYLDRHNANWRKDLGWGRKVAWPIGYNAKGCAGVIGLMVSFPGSIGYVELSYALKNTTPAADLRNESGKYVAPSITSAITAMESMASPTGEWNMDDTFTATRGYPLTGFTYILAPGAGAKASLKPFLVWALVSGQGFAADLLYAPLPSAIRKRVLAKVAAMD
ncbi:MAG: phosphate ABC transporter substrate-binding protein PstS [Capsulimonas sp.]|uniref:phosphate ABC transporter substrate-binding protein PstS n=1 Tax=Capsulimonas sp. TaxID=2494211 RepID=UPI0032665D6C